MFSGIGGFELSIGTKGQCIGYSEIDRFADAVYQNQFNGHKNFGDATKIKHKKIPDFDLLVGGFPCQAFSIAGLRKGFKDSRGTLFFDICRILKAKKPKHFILENVKGLLSHDNGRTFKRIVSTLADLRYNLEWQVLNSKDFGVPQNRERVFLIGYYGKVPRPEVFPILKRTERNSESIETESQTGNSKPLICPTIDTEVGRTTHYGTYILEELTKGTSDAQRIYSANGIAKTLKGLGGGLGAKTGLYAVSYTRDTNGRITKYHLRKNYGTVKQRCGNQEKYITDLGFIRRLTPIECERLQGFSDDWTKYGLFDGEVKEMSDTQRYKTLGNAVTVNVVREIIERLFI